MKTVAFGYLVLALSLFPAPAIALDSDLDSLPDEWELANGRNPLQADYLLASGRSHACAIDDRGVHCWGENGDGQTDVPVLTNPVLVAPGSRHTCALENTGVHCWGYNRYGQTDVPALTNPVALSTGDYHTCALDDYGVSCWGRNIVDQIDVPPLSDPIAISAGANHTCAIDSNGVQCWGANGHGQIDVPSIQAPLAISAGATHTCALTDSGVICWGQWDDFYYDGYYDYYIAEPIDASVVPTLSNPRAISAGTSYTCALDDNGVQCWGVNEFGDGNVDYNYGEPPVLVNPANISVGKEYVCALDDRGVSCWGDGIDNSLIPDLVIDPDSDAVNNQGGLDAFPLDPEEWKDNDLDGTGDNADTDDDNDGIADAEDNCPFVANSQQSDLNGNGAGLGCDYDDDSDGLPDRYEVLVGLNPNDPSDLTSDFDMDGANALVEFELGLNPKRKDSDGDSLLDGWEISQNLDPLLADYQVSTGGNHACALDDSGVICWGDNSYRQTDVPALSNPISVSSGATHSCALDDSGIVCWGGWYRYVYYRSEVLEEYWYDASTSVPPLDNPRAVVAGRDFSCAMEDRGVTCWGNGDSRRILNYFYPLANPVSISAGYEHFCALDANGVRCWGDNSLEQLNVPFLSNPVAISASTYRTCALDDNGVTCWGLESFGAEDTPALAVAIAAGISVTCAADDLSPRCWENDSQGQPTTQALVSPAAISEGSNNTCILSESGVICWGRSDYGVNDVPALQIDPDGDGFSNQYGLDRFPMDNSEWMDTDSDGVGNNADSDDDNDEVADTEDNCPFNSNVDQSDLDGDNMGDVCDDDIDGDGYSNQAGLDAFPLDSTEWTDTDGDGVGNNADYDDDNDEVADAEDNCPLIQNTDQLDVDGNGIGDACESSSRISLYKFDDINGNGVSDVGQFGLRKSELGRSEKPQLVIKDPSTGEHLISYTWQANWLKVQLVQLSDLNGDGIREVGVFGYNKYDHRPQLAVKDGSSAVNLATWNWPANWNRVRFLELDDLNNDGFREFAIAGFQKSTGRPSVVVREGIDPSLPVTVINWPLVWNNIEFVEVPDINGDGIAEVAVFGQPRGDGRYRLVIKNVKDPSASPTVYDWGDAWSSLELRVIKDLDGDGIDDIAVVGERKDNDRPQLIANSGANRGQTPKRFGWPAVLEPIDYLSLPDRDGDNLWEVALVGRRTDDDRTRIVVKSSSQAKTIQTVGWNSNWTDRRVFELSDHSGDGKNDFALLGNRKGEGQAQLVIIDSATNNPLQPYTWPSMNVSQASLLEIDDINGDGTKEIGLYSVLDDRGTLEIKNGRNPREILRIVEWPSAWH
ncbi:hypothetical protein G8764_07570 [Pseudomaricurvus alcaniphilus]|uniref:RCC1 domain-containing protein n=1 Tax=Pseudomaricurvus alcaniphilus TaxID=1166482 RepID=UPI00140D5F07|nr:thrombospondin type 3 repeat-containing protein [Pseudomaricurvus alcaniphilus]NHN37147.1 hypothetical protein [Pseudomaricurvus alcaniphilus]